MAALSAPAARTWRSKSRKRATIGSGPRWKPSRWGPSKETMETREQTSFLAALPQIEANPAGPAWLRPLRQDAARRFAETGFPSRRDEEWRFTPIAPIVETPFAPAPPSTISAQTLRPYTYDQLSANRAVVVNGRFVPELSSVTGLPHGVVVSSLAQAMESHPALV